MTSNQNESFHFDISESVEFTCSVESSLPLERIQIYVDDAALTENRTAVTVHKPDISVPLEKYVFTVKVSNLSSKYFFCQRITALRPVQPSNKPACHNGVVSKISTLKCALYFI